MHKATPSAHCKCLPAFLLLHVLFLLTLLLADTDKFLHLHLLLDTGNAALSLMLAVFLLGEHSDLPPQTRQRLTIGFGFAAATELLHALVGVEWGGRLNWIHASAHTLRPGTWPPSTYALPLALAWTLWLMRRNSKLRATTFAAGMALLTLGLYLLSLSLPRYANTGLLGIHRPTQLPLLLLLLGVIAAYWRERHVHPLFEGLALMGVLLFLSDLCMLYSTSPHEKFAMLAHFDKLLAYVLMHVVQMRIAAADSRRRCVAEAALSASESRLRMIIETEPECVSVVDRDGQLLEMNAAGLAMFEAASLDELQQHTLNKLILPEYRASFVALQRRVWNGENDVLGFEITGLHGTRRWLETHATRMHDATGNALLLAVTRDITARKQAEEAIHTLAFHDPLTRLPNRRLLLERLRRALLASARDHHYGAVLFLDMDRFKTLNDTLGHDYGDLLLIEVARRLRCCVREVDTVARLGGDEFVVVLEKIGTSEQEASQRLAPIAEKVRSALSAAYHLQGHEHHSSPSIGVCLYLGNEEPAMALLKHADVAMYQAKAAGRNAVRFFNAAMQQAAEAHAALEDDLRHAVPDRQLRLYYQVQMDNEQRPLGAEALVRWVHPKRGLVLPAQFLPVAEESSLMLEIGQWVLETACRQLAEWGTDERTRQLTLAVNISARHFRLHGFVDRVASLLRDHRIEPSRLKLELTESVVMNDVAEVVAKMHALKALGVGLSLDDFGTGHSSLSHLKRLPLDELKIDQSFVRGIATDPSDAVMVNTIIGLARSFSLNVIAEGVETAAQLDYLRRNGCMAYQGHLFGRPVPIGDFEALLGITATGRPEGRAAERRLRAAAV